MRNRSRYFSKREQTASWAVFTEKENKGKITECLLPAGNTPKRKPIHFIHADSVQCRTHVQHDTEPFLAKKPAHNFFDPAQWMYWWKCSRSLQLYFVTSSRPIPHAPQGYMNVHYAARWGLWLMNANQIKHGPAIWIHTQMAEEKIHWALIQMFGMGRGFVNNWENYYI